MTASYIYALVRPCDVFHLDQPGIDGGTVRLVAGDHIAAVVSTVDDSLFDAKTVEARANDLGWLASLARAHDGVVNAAAAGTTTVPLRLGTTCADDASVRALLYDLAPAAVSCLSRLHGRAEWGVQLLAAPRPPEPREATMQESGTAFLRRRRGELQQADALRVADEAKAAAVYNQLAACSVDAQRRPIRTQHARPMLLNAAFLVDASSEDRFRRGVEDVADAFGSHRVVLTGPWAPYSFAELSP